MSERQQLERLLDQPNARKMLDLIANGEGVKHGYNTLFGNQRFDNLQAHPNVRKEFTQTDGKKNYTTAAGRYQFLKSTWDGLSKQYGLKDFSPRNQDLAALALIAKNGALKNVMNGDFGGAVSKLGGTWASLPSSPYAQPKKTYAQLGLGSGPSKQPNQPNFLSSDQVAKLFPQNQRTSNQPKYLSSEEVVRIFPQNTDKPKYLSGSDVGQLFPQNKQSAPEPNYLSAEQAAKLFPGG